MYAARRLSRQTNKPRALRAEGADVLNLAFGECGVSAADVLVKTLSDAAGETHYGPVQGDSTLRAAVAGYFSRRGLATRSSQVIVGPGSKALLYAMISATPGRVLLPTPSWVSYEPQARLANKSIRRLTAAHGRGGFPDLAELDATLSTGWDHGAQPDLVLITVPDNPTSTMCDPTDLKALVDLVRHRNALVVVDAIYHDLIYSVQARRWMDLIADDDLPAVVTTGLSKAFGCGGWRVGALRVPHSELGGALMSRLTTVASEIWSAIPSPISRAATIAFSEPPEIRRRVDATRRVYEAMNVAAHRTLRELGVDCPAPTGGFYLYPSLVERSDALHAREISSDSDLVAALVTNRRIGLATRPRLWRRPQATSPSALDRPTVRRLDR